MSTCEMLAVIRDADRERAEARRIGGSCSSSDLRALLALPAYPEANAPLPERPAPAYCHWIESLERLVLPKTAEAQMPAQGAQDAAERGGRRRRARTPCGVPQERGRRRPRRASCRDRASRRFGTGDPQRGKRPQQHCRASAAVPGRHPLAGGGADAWRAAPGAPARPEPARFRSNVVQLVAHRHGRGPGRRRHPPGRPLLGRSPQEVGHQLRLHVVRDHRDRAWRCDSRGAASAW